MTYIFYYSYSYTNYILEVLKENPNNVLVPIKIESRINNYILGFNRRLDMTLLSPIKYNYRIKDILSKITEKDDLLFFDYLTYDNVKYILNKIKCNNIHFWFWNTVNKWNSLLFRFRSDKTHYHTFDGKDALIYNMRLHNQFYRRPQITLPSINPEGCVDFFFIGNNKGRLEQIKRLDALLQRMNYSRQLIVIDKHLKEINSEGLTIQKDEIDYREVIEMVKRAKVLVDLNKQDQEGLTLRCLEGIFFDKKILTNNTAIKNMPFYNPHNILIFTDTTTKEEIESFMVTEVVPYSEDIKRDYSVEHWFKTVMKLK